MKFRLSKIADCLGVEASFEDQEIFGYSIDSRTTLTGDLFFAICGPMRDGHEYVSAALENGASAAVVSASWAARNKVEGPLLAVENPSQALGELAGYARRSWGKPLVAVTGSNGKTTTKELTAAMLKTRYRTAKSEGNLNNELGLPLSLLRFKEESEIGVIEMGMNHTGEIRKLASIASPSVGVVTNVNAVHLEHFSSLGEIALAKRELIEELPSEATAVLNNDDPRVAGFKEIFSGPSVTFGIDTPADFQAVNIEILGAQGVRFRLSSRVQKRITGAYFESPLPGRHNVANILAALATVSIFGIEANNVRDLLAGFQPQKMRGEVLKLSGVTILNDCYNSSPKALSEMLTVLQNTPATRRVAVLGEMLELGPEAITFHRVIGQKIVKMNVDLLITVGGSAREIVASAVKEQFSPSSAFCFDDTATAGSFLTSVVRPGDAVLFKASRGVHLEQTVAALRQSLEEISQK